MAVVIGLLAFALLAVVIAVIGAPLRANAKRPSADADSSPERAELEAAREAKYHEIRDAELDFRTGKLSREDYATIDAALRAEALTILNRLEAPASPPSPRRPADVARDETTGQSSP